MRRAIPLPSLQVAPSLDVALRRQGIPEGHTVSQAVMELAETAITLYESLAQPQGIISEISLADFMEVFHGEGMNTLPAPLPGIVDQADALALFAATVGEAVTNKIRALFETNDPATACMLDGIASERAETATLLLATSFGQGLVMEAEAHRDMGVLPYSPGYCGWHISGQKKLFAYLRPEEIGITLSPTHLMSPLKSVSGVLVAGERRIHDFENDFEFCYDCASWECRSRIASIVHISPTKQ